MYKKKSAFLCIYQEVMEVYVDDILVKSKRASKHIRDLNNCFNILRQYQMKVNPANVPLESNLGSSLGS